MFLLVSGRHAGAHTDGTGMASINLGKKFLCISCVRKIAMTWILARVFVFLPSLISQILDFTYWTVLIFILNYFELRDTENQQFKLLLKFRNVLKHAENGSSFTYNQNIREDISTALEVYPCFETKRNEAKHKQILHENIHATRE